MNNIKILYYNRIDVSEGIDIHKTGASKEHDICHNWYFLNKGFKFQPYVCNRCYDLLISMKYKRRKKFRERYQTFTEEENETRFQYYQERKQKLPEYRKIYN